MTVEVLELHQLTETERPITYGVVKPGVEDTEKGVLFWMFNGIIYTLLYYFWD